MPPHPPKPDGESRPPRIEPIAPREDSPDEIDALVREFGRLARDAPKDLAARLESLPLRRQADLLLRLPAAERLEVLLHAPQPMRLVRALPDAELYLTVREVGLHDALPLLSLASGEQIQHVLDLEGWRKDRFDGDRSGAWIAVLLEAGEPTIRRFLRQADDELLSLLFARWARVKQIASEDSPERDHRGENEAGADAGFVSPDGMHIFSPTIVEHALAVRRIAEVLFEEQQARYFNVLHSAIWELPDDLEEQELHWRQSRLEEHGFPDWETALSVYAPPSGVRGRSEPPTPSKDDALAAPRAVLRAAPETSLVLQAMDDLGDAAREAALFELTAVANRVLVADGADTGDTAAHRGALETAAGYASIALSRRGARDGAAASPIVREIPILELFREGYAAAVELRVAATRLRGEGWLACHPRADEMLDPPIRQRLLGLLEARPKYFDPFASGPETSFRPFRGIDEVEESRLSLELASLLGRVLTDALGWNVLAAASRTPRPQRAGDLFLTSLVWHATSGNLRGEPLQEQAARAFLDAGPSGQALELFLARLREKLALGPRDAAELRAFARASHVRLEEETRAIRESGKIEPRKLTCVLLAARSAR